MDKAARIHYTKPSITEREVALAEDAARNGWGEQCYAYIYRFEAAWREHLGRKHAIATSSCTGALHMGMCALGIGAGDEVILADTNWIATVSPVVHLGAKPVFVDILPTSWCLDPERVRGAITPRTKAIIATHLYGNLCEMNELLALAQEHGLALIEDSAEAIGSVYHGRRAGSMGTFATYSFHGTKTLTTGEGGMFVTDDDALYEEVLTLGNHGRARGQKKQFWADVVGFKYKLSNIQAAIGCAQMERIGELVARKQAILRAYRERLEALPGLSLNVEPEGVEIGAWMPTVVFAPELGVTREQVQEACVAADIDARVFFYPLSAQPMFEEVRDNKHAWEIPERALNLPSYHDMDEAQIDRVAEAVKSCLK